MGAETIVAAVIGLAGAAGSYIAGKRTAVSSSMGIAADTVAMLQVQVATLVRKNEEKDVLVTNLNVRVEVLEGLVTQRAEVELVHREVQDVRGVVDRIATKVGA